MKTQKKNVIQIKFDKATEIKKVSREIFKDSKRGSNAHRAKNLYSRKAKHKSPKGNSEGDFFYTCLKNYIF